MFARTPLAKAPLIGRESQLGEVAQRGREGYIDLPAPANTWGRPHRQPLWTGQSLRSSPPGNAGIEKAFSPAFPLPPQSPQPPTYLGPAPRPRHPAFALHASCRHRTQLHTGWGLGPYIQVHVLRPSSWHRRPRGAVRGPSCHRCGRVGPCQAVTQQCLLWVMWAVHPPSTQVVKLTVHSRLVHVDPQSGRCTSGQAASSQQ